MCPLFLLLLHQLHLRSSDNRSWRLGAPALVLSFIYAVPTCFLFLSHLSQRELCCAFLNMATSLLPPLPFLILSPFSSLGLPVLHWGTSAPRGVVVKNLPFNAGERRVWPLGWEDHLKEGMASLSSILAWRIQQTEEPGGPQSIEWPRVRHNWSNLAQHTQRTFLCRLK